MRKWTHASGHILERQCYQLVNMQHCTVNEAVKSAAPNWSMMVWPLTDPGWVRYCAVCCAQALCNSLWPGTIAAGPTPPLQAGRSVWDVRALLALRHNGPLIARWRSRPFQLRGLIIGRHVISRVKREMIAETMFEEKRQLCREGWPTCFWKIAQVKSPFLNYPVFCLAAMLKLSCFFFYIWGCAPNVGSHAVMIHHALPFTRISIEMARLLDLLCAISQWSLWLRRAIEYRREPPGDSGAVAGAAG